MLRRRLAAAHDQPDVRSGLNASLGSLLAPAGAWPAETAGQCPRSTPASGHEDQLPPWMASGRCGFGERTFPKACGNDEVAPNPAVWLRAVFGDTKFGRHSRNGRTDSKIRWWKHRAGSSPARGTIDFPLIYRGFLNQLHTRQSASIKPCLSCTGGDIARQRADVVLDQPSEPFGGAGEPALSAPRDCADFARSSPRWRTGCDLVAKIQNQN